jgi:hypothetical protein
MNVIYIEKKWLDMIGDIKDILLIGSEDGDYISVLAMEKRLEITFPFVEANLIRKLDTDDEEYFLPAKIPVLQVWLRSPSQEKEDLASPSVFSLVLK